ncbi:LysR family transcriptional regulator, partial [Mycetohabitans sp. B6]|uniref:helix-turn-helix domain-containing protein n=1 Tax=Mycetohabitans sp. B6 TaxID=2841843 RepID=UPI001F1EF1DD
LEAASRRRSFSRAAEALHLTHSDFYDRHPLVDLALRMRAEVEPPDPYSVDVGIWHRRQLLDPEIWIVGKQRRMAHRDDLVVEQLPCFESRL